MSLEVPQVYAVHVFACFQSRPPGHPRGSCGANGAEALWKRLGWGIESLGDPRIAMTATGCLGFCAAGPLMVVYPQGIWYAPKSEADIDEIVDNHFAKGEPVERLIVVPRV